MLALLAEESALAGLLRWDSDFAEFLIRNELEHAQNLQESTENTAKASGFWLSNDGKTEDTVLLSDV